MATTKTPSNKPNELHLTRVYDAPVKAVWDAWADPAQVAQWWGPRGFTITTHSKDLRAGGHWSYTMHGPDGTNYENKTLYHVVEPLAKLVYDHGGNDDRAPLFRVTVTFAEVEPGKTRMDMTMALPSPEALEETRNIIKKHSGNSTWDRLAEYLGKARAGKDIFVINRTFDAPLDLIYQVWSDPEHFGNWLAPKGFTMNCIRADIRPGGSLFYSMTNGTVTMYGRINYLEFSKPTRLVYTQQFMDENEKVSRHPMAPTWPETMLTTVTFTPESPTSTRVTVQWEPHGPATKEEIETFLNARPGMTGGWTGSFDKLESYLASR